ncbi:SDR family NAD(P)-dependent oxidoreductase [Pediococcus argentinicus]|uniref:SDR family NAD(P)-dependent oxidoreductase n=1 Tax=Pediococcus argentinicus TaxID=480391 RepID=UPI00338F5494
MTKTWFITGSSRGLGRAIAEEALQNGEQVVATARKVASLDDLVAKYADLIYPLSLDVSDNDAVQKTISEAVEHFGKIDVLVNNAGYADLAPVEEMSLETFKAQMDTDFYGTLYTIKAVLPLMREQKSGHIINISSIGGRIGGASLGAYQSAKFAVNGLTEVTAQEVAPFNVRVTTIEPGGMSTDWGGKSMTTKTSSNYKDTVGQAISYIHDQWNSDAPRYVSDPKKVAKAIFKVSNMDDAPVHLLMGKDAAPSAKQHAEELAASDAEYKDLTESTTQTK